MLVAKSIDCDRDYSGVTLGDLLAMRPEELAGVDPLASNLLVAREIPSLASLEIAPYQRILNEWADAFRTWCLPQWEPYFHEAPEDFRNDIDFFRFGMLFQFLDREIGIAYREDQTHVASILYTNPSDLFLNGVIDTRRGTCGNMAALHVAIAWRLGWPVSLACVNSHFICRFDDGERVFNLETTDTGRGGWSARTDQRYVDEVGVSLRAIEAGSDLKALTHREMLGAFIGLRARHLKNVGESRANNQLMLQSESDWLLARWLFPAHRVMYRNQIGISALRGEYLFDFDETGHPISLGEFLLETYGGTHVDSGLHFEEPDSSSVSPEILDTMEINEFFSHGRMEQ
ncbi:MAG: hypothetical protein O3B86_12950 [Planctomycetota bacterium]|nr:hypothetical protein [Planctomycetota bacterium]